MTFSLLDIPVDVGFDSTLSIWEISPGEDPYTKPYSAPPTKTNDGFGGIHPEITQSTTTGRRYVIKISGTLEADPGNLFGGYQLYLSIP